MSEEWKTVPDGGGWWWRTDGNFEQEIFFVENGKFYGSCYGWECGVAIQRDSLSKWQRVAPHTPIPKPLPKTREVRAVVRYEGDYREGTYYAELFMNDKRVSVSQHDRKDWAIEQCKNTWGLEPEVVE